MTADRDTDSLRNVSNGIVIHSLICLWSRSLFLVQSCPYLDGNDWKVVRPIEVGVSFTMTQK